MSKLTSSLDPEIVAPTSKRRDTFPMRFEAQVGEDGEILIPSDVCRALGLFPDTMVEVQVANVLRQPKNREPDWEKLKELRARLQEPMRQAFLADGYETVDAYIDDIRGR